MINGEYLSRRSFVTSLALAASSLASGKAFARGRKGYYYIVAADPQLWWKEDDVSAWEKTVSVINGLKPDFMLVCGDLLSIPNEVSTVNWSRADKMAESYLKVERKLDLGIDVYRVPGNHDECMSPTSDTLKWYEKRFGKSWHSFVHKNSLYIGLDSNVMGYPEKVSAQAQRQMEWLERLLRTSVAAKHEHRVVFMHHPPFIKKIDEESTYHNLPKGIRSKLVDMCLKYDVEMIFSGHLHANAYTKHKGMELISTASCCHSHNHPMGLRIVHVDGAKTYDMFYSFDDMPRRLEDFSIKKK